MAVQRTTTPLPRPARVANVRAPARRISEPSLPLALGVPGLLPPPAPTAAEGLTGRCVTTVSSPGTSPLSAQIKLAGCLLRVEQEDGRFVLHEMQTRDQEQGGVLAPVFQNGKLVRKEGLSTIRARLAG